MTRMNWQQKKQLTKALLDSSTSMGNRDTRQNIVEQLPSQIRIRIRRSDIDFNDVLSIVSTCEIFPNGLLQLQQIVLDFDGGAEPSKVIRQLFDEILSTYHSRLPTVDLCASDHKSDAHKSFVHEENESSFKPPLPQAILLNDRYQVFDFPTISSKNEFVAYDKYQKTRVVLQTISTNNVLSDASIEETVERFQKLSHKHLSKVIDHFVKKTDKGSIHYFVTEFIEGLTLEEVVSKRGKLLTKREALGYIEQICQAVQYLHEQKPAIIHRDIAPNHIKIQPDRAVLTNLGAAVLFSQTNVDSAEGATPIINEGYTPIEQYERTTDATISSDIYALGATLYRLITNQVPPDSKQRFMDGVVCTRPNKINREVDRSLSEAILDALELDMPKRPHSVTEWLQQLQNILYEETMKYLTICNPLEALLEKGKWKEADQETTKIIHSIVNQQARGRPGRITDLPDAAFDVINSHWERCSGGRYSFRIQFQIWQEVAQDDLKQFTNDDFREFRYRVGWSVDERELDYQQFIFSSEGPEGHLPSMKDVESTGPNSFIAWRSNVKEILLRTASCLL